MTDAKTKIDDSGGIRTHASEKTGALNQRLRPLGHAIYEYSKLFIKKITVLCF